MRSLSPSRIALSTRSFLPTTRVLFLPRRRDPIVARAVRGLVPRLGAREPVFAEERALATHRHDLAQALVLHEAEHRAQRGLARVALRGQHAEREVGALPGVLTADFDEGDVEALAHAVAQLAHDAALLLERVGVLYNDGEATDADVHDVAAT